MLTSSPSLSCHRFGEYTYARNPVTRQDYLYNASAYDVINFVAQTGSCDCEDVVNHLRELYEIKDDAAFIKDIQAFVAGLIKDGVLVSAGVDSGAAKEDVSASSISGILEDYCADNHLLYSAVFELTYRCNEHCVHCYIDDSSYGGELSTEDYMNLIDQIVDLGCARLLLTGGESFLRDDLCEIAEYAILKGLLLDVFTNGYRVPIDRLRKLINLGPNSISFSLYGGTAAVHDAFTRVAGSFDATLRSLMVCKCAGVDTYIKSIATKLNLDDLEDLYELGHFLGIPVEIARMLLPSHEGSLDVDSLRIVDKEDFTRLAKLSQRYKDTKIVPRARNSRMRLCNAGACTLSIDPYGVVHPCNSLDMELGNVKLSNLQEIWDNAANFIERKIPRGFVNPRCETCEYSKYCGLCLGCLSRTGDEFKLNSSICNHAQSLFEMG